MSDYIFETDEFKEELQEYTQKINKKTNIFICGGTGVGKSSLINDLFGATVAKVGENACRGSEGIQKYSLGSLNLFDSEGYEVGDDRQRHYWEDILGFVNEPENGLHAVWYCVSAGGGRFLGVDREIVRTLKKEGIPVSVVVTQVDLVSEQDLTDLKAYIKSKEPDVPVFTYSTHKDPELEPYIQKEDMITWATENMKEEARPNFLKYIQGSLEEKNRFVIKSVVSMYAGIAASIVTATSFIPVPFTDSVALMGIQVKMTNSIIKSYDLDSTSNILINVAEAQFLSLFGKTLAGQLVALIPGFGVWAKAAANATVAATLTATWGIAVSYLCCQYKSGKIKGTFSEVLSADNLKDAMDWAQKNGMVDSVVKSIEAKGKQIE